MSDVRLPWVDVPGPVYTAQALKPRKKWVSAGGWILSAVLVVGGFLTPYRILVLFGVLYLLTMLMVKDTVVTSRGVETFYQMRITTHYDFLGWDRIETVVREASKDPLLWALYFAYGDRVKRLYFSKPDTEQIMALAKAQNPKIKVAEADEAPPSAAKKQRKPR